MDSVERKFREGRQWGWGDSKINGNVGLPCILENVRDRDQHKLIKRDTHWTDVPFHCGCRGILEFLEKIHLLILGTRITRKGWLTSKYRWKF